MKVITCCYLHLIDRQICIGWDSGWNLPEERSVSRVEQRPFLRSNPSICFETCTWSTFMTPAERPRKRNPDVTRTYSTAVSSCHQHWHSVNVRGKGIDQSHVKVTTSSSLPYMPDRNSLSGNTKHHWMRVLVGVSLDFSHLMHLRVLCCRSHADILRYLCWNLFVYCMHCQNVTRVESVLCFELCLPMGKWRRQVLGNQRDIKHDMESLVANKRTMGRQVWSKSILSTSHWDAAWGILPGLSAGMCCQDWAEHQTQMENMGTPFQTRPRLHVYRKKWQEWEKASPMVLIYIKWKMQLYWSKKQNEL